MSFFAYLGQFCATADVADGADGADAVTFAFGSFVCMPFDSLNVFLSI